MNNLKDQQNNVGSNIIVSLVSFPAQLPAAILFLSGKVGLVLICRIQIRGSQSDCRVANLMRKSCVVTAAKWRFYPNILFELNKSAF